MTAAGVPRVSVVVPTRNSAQTLEACLASVRSQTHQEVELIVVDNHSTDMTRDIADRFADIVLVAGPERSAQRNRGAARAGGEFLLFCDSDMVLGPEVVAACMDAVTDADAVVIPEATSGVGFLAACKALERSCYVGDETIEAARFFRRDAFQRLGGYDERLTGPEDWDLPARMLECGATIARADALIVHDEGRLSLRELLRSKYYYGRSFAPYVARHPQLARRQIRLIRPAFVRHWRRLMRRPVLSLGMIAMKTAELVAGGTGYLRGRLLDGDRPA
jgi:arabinofuranan 3-O-arabinosyltransferase